MAEHIQSDFVAFLNGLKKGRIEEYEIEISGNVQGRGFVGDIELVTLTDRKSQVKEYLVVKQQKFHDGPMDEWCGDMFQNEILFYETIWPTLHKFYQKNTGKSINFIPKCLGTAKGDVMRIAMENVKVGGYDTYDPLKPYDADHINKLFTIYGVYHGISMSFIEQNEEECSRIVDNIYTFARKMVATEDENNDGYLLQIIRGVQPYFDSVTEKHLLDKLLNYEKTVMKDLIKSFDRKTGPKVIVHGDGWCNNLMFKYDVSLFFSNLLKFLYLFCDWD